MDWRPARPEHYMARWTLAGSAAVVAGPLALVIALRFGLGWRRLFLVLAGASAALVLLTLRIPWSGPGPSVRGGPYLRRFAAGLAESLAALRKRPVLRWLALLEFADLLLDVLHGFLALYFVDVAGISPIAAGAALAVWTGAGLIGDAALIPLLERIDGVRYLRFSALALVFCYPAFLLAPGIPEKLVLLGLLGLLNAGWYAILQARLYAELPGMSGRVMTIGTVTGLAGALIPVGLGIAAESYGLATTMWLLVLAPVALLIGLPRPTG